MSISRFAFGLLVCAATSWMAKDAQAQFGPVVQSVGGVYIDTAGVLSLPTQQMNQQARMTLSHHMNKVGQALGEQVDLRMVSLKGLEAALNKAVAEGTDLPGEARYLAGIQRIEYVFVQPDSGDIVLAGPGEGWTVDELGNVVGEKSGCPVIRLEDLITALRSADAARSGHGISVSIDPTQEGINRLQALFRDSGFQPALAQAVEQAMGPQLISLTGVPESSRAAQVLVAADYKMKRMAMGFDQAPVTDMPSVLDLAKSRRTAGSQMSPRFWMECSYNPVERSEDGLAWHISGPGAKTRSEEGGSKNRLADQWAETMSENFEQLASQEPAFCELRNFMDLAVVAALINKEKMLDQVQLELPFMLGQRPVEVPTWSVPKTVPTHCSFVRVRDSWMVTASGGVQVDSWSVAANSKVDNSIAAVRQKAIMGQGDEIWWNGPATN